VNSPPLPADAVCCPRGRGRTNKIKIKIKINKFIFLVVVAGLKREKKHSGFWFSIPKIPKILELRGLCGRSRKKKKVFLA
jgi:hypothetical protein